MEQRYSKEQIISDTIKYIIRAKGSRIAQQQIQEFIRILTPKGTLCLEHWLKLKGDIQNIYDQNGSSGVPIFICTIWTQIQDVTDDKRELE